MNAKTRQMPRAPSAPNPPQTPKAPPDDGSATATVTATVEQPAGNRSATVDQPDALPDAPRAVDAWKALGGAENRDSITVYRVDAADGVPAFLFSVDAETTPDALMRRLRRDYGPGQYRLQIREGGRINANKLIAVEAEPEPGAALHGARAPRGDGDGIDFTKFLFQQLMAQQQQTTTIMTAALGRPLPPERQGVDVAKVLTAAAPLVAPVIAGMFELVKGAKPDALGLVRQVAEIRDLLSGDGGGDEPKTGATAMDAILQIGKTFAPLLLQGAQQMQMQAQQQPRPQIVSAPAVTHAPAQPGAPVVEPVAPPAVTAAQLPPGHPLPHLLATLVTGAIKDGDPASYADLVLDQWPMPLEQLAALLADPKWLDQLAQFEPRVTAYAPWFGELREAILEAASGEGEEASSTAGNDDAGSREPAAA